MLTEKAAMYSTLGISKEVFAFGTKIEEELKERFAKIDEIAEYNQLKVIHAMQASKVSEACLYGTTGYGYNDLGRDTLEQVYATCFGTEDALVRPQIACGTHALATALSGNLRPGDELLSPVGKPYDTLEEVIGIRPSVGSLAEYGVTYRQVDLKEDGSFDYEGIKNAINKKTKMVTIQRSKGYQTRPTLSVTRIGELIAFIKNIKPDVICMVDNCYGEFVETIEPTNAVVPNGTESRHDIIQAVTFGKPEGVIAFCQGIQAAAPVDSFVSPEPWDMPGYDSPVIMAAGAFVQGSSIELSADGPIKPPYAVYFQGGLTWQHAKFGILMSLQKLVDAGMVTL